MFLISSKGRRDPWRNFLKRETRHTHTHTQRWKIKETSTEDESEAVIDVKVCGTERRVGILNVRTSSQWDWQPFNMKQNQKEETRRIINETLKYMNHNNIEAMEMVWRTRALRSQMDGLVKEPLKCSLTTMGLVGKSKLYWDIIPNYYWMFEEAGKTV